MSAAPSLMPPFVNGHRVCPVTGCGRAIFSGLLMCKSHWFMVPAPLRDEVRRTYTAMARVESHKKGDEAIAAYRLAASEAVRAVDEKVARLSRDKRHGARSA